MTAGPNETIVIVDPAGGVLTPTPADVTAARRTAPLPVTAGGV
jgi:hypothetical protein